MARGIEGNEISTPKPTLKKSSSSQSSSKNQRSILGFFSKQASGTPKPTFNQPKNATASQLTPAPSSDVIAPSSPIEAVVKAASGKNKENGLPSPSSSSQPNQGADDAAEIDGVNVNSPSRKAKKSINYAETDDEEDVLKPADTNKPQRRPSKRRKVSVEDSDDEFGFDEATQAAMDEADIDDFVAPDESDEEISVPHKRKRLMQKTLQNKSASPPPKVRQPSEDDFDMDIDMTTNSTDQWKYDPNDTEVHQPRPTQAKKPSTAKQAKPKAHTTEPEKRHAWLANPLDADRYPPDHPDYDPRTLYIPPNSMAQLSAFEQQYWTIKSKFMDTIVFFKKGKFYELYEQDATVGHQQFDLKLTDRVNMRMVGVPESSLDMWANQFVAKGHKIARVDQLENALSKEMRERDEKKSNVPKKKGEIIRRELAAVLTSGTLVDGGMLQDDMSTYCVAIKETERDGLPVFGIAFVDAATAQFQLSEFVDDVDMTKFETFVAQIRPGELLVEKSCISARALRILKNNTTPTTLWNYLKPGKEFWAADIACREIDASGYFVSKDSDGDSTDAWPAVLREAKDKDLIMSALGALVQYLRVLKIERDLVSLGNFTWYDPIQKSSSLVLDGQSLINLEIFANTFDGGQEGTLFTMLNRCITPFGKRMLRQWICHPLADAHKINARLDAVDALLADSSLTNSFTASLSRLPDLERLLSRVHAGRLKAQDFVKVLDGFEQIEYTMSLLGKFSGGDGLIGQLISSMPDMGPKLKEWKNAFDRNTATTEGVLVPEPGVESDYDESQETINDIEQSLQTLLKGVRKDLGSPAICFRDSGKEIYQVEVPIKFTKGVPKNWDQMSATKAVKRYYSPELRKLVRKLQEAQETHSQIVKEVAGRFYARFDEEYSMWLSAVKIVAHLDCLISLAQASGSLGLPSCRPTFVNDERTVVEFEELRHPCMLTNVADFIPNDIRLGGDAPNIDLLTGANAAGKSTVLRMTCIAVILAQIGCHLPCTSARLTPVDRIMSRLGAFDNIFAAQSTFFVELTETKKILSEATSRSLVILDELGRGTSSYDGVAVAQAVLHDVATRIGCVGFFATHYHSLAAEFCQHPEIRCCRMAIDVDAAERRVTFLYRLEDGVAEGSFGMHCAAMCGIPAKVIERAEVAAREWEHTSRLKGSLDKAREACYVPLGMQSDVSWLLKEGKEDEVENRALEVLRKAIATL
ncbi:putative DNA mismatch repair protein Msh6 [Tothia fuscella]|uniref:DNA mismatch repair protein n=1 Tax=Tothia fuscella TaxID=1048955 RepID=A0A9P4P1X9_9PEZI|nr:putative DNA mismatch repair protein Msh6 [Tothia fuscella]